MKIFKVFMTIALFSIALNSCRRVEYIDPNLKIPGIGGTVYPDMILEDGTNLDEWLRETFLENYNIDVVYRWDATQIYKDLIKKLVPVKVEKVKPMLQTISDVWFGPYRNCASWGFLQKFTPKVLVLVGSLEYSGNGAVSLGFAEGGTKIVLTDVNSFSSTNRAQLKNYMHVIEHEFTHVLNQNRKYKPDFEKISVKYDNEKWKALSDDDHQAWELGFFSNYSMSSPDEDYAEVLSLLLVNGLNWFENEVIPIARESKADSSAEQKLRNKVAHVEKYLKDEFEIDLLDDTATGKRGLVSHVQQAIDYAIQKAVDNQ